MTTKLNTSNDLSMQKIFVFSLLENTTLLLLPVHSREDTI